MDRPHHFQKEREHGGALANAAAIYGRDVGDWVDLSTGINPISYPIPVLSTEAWTRLPEANAHQAFQAVAADYLGVTDPHLITAAPGTQCLIQMLPGLRPVSNVAVISPTYNEHAHVWASFGHRVVEVSGLEQLDDSIDVVVVVNPNNPDGQTYQPDILLDLADTLSARGGWLVVDEAFADVTPEFSVASAAGRAGLVVLRSFGKFFGLAGLRLGMILGSREMQGMFDRHLGPWAVPGPALAIGTQAYTDHHWITETRQRLGRDRARLTSLLSNCGFDIVGATDLFVLAASDDATERYQRLAEDGILLRKFSYDETWLRVGLPGPQDHWDRLQASLNRAT
ncbi:MAG: threonine-phosphate decarboxylase [Rhodospirillaceae bacterium]|nr:threonine-phosphate decarboxylase [Rhodospirillaceae bacterium]MBT4220042.1 threonine-phosphate decarboxylase [Rhodospirillaceae bacterium]MBT4463419.1 threonine-phosphate decarboxylase [Rhodospirillaceae bacterium]MBT5308980.1 threonine-phosphate decarboxylase [Rhodospirillaceae bacterium]MBT6407501.1 threonine-phosphate decarboxylase [Rhodospirillaceae bacterium]